MKEIIKNTILTIIFFAIFFVSFYFLTIRADKICSDYSRKNNGGYRECIGI